MAISLVKGRSLSKTFQMHSLKSFSVTAGLFLIFSLNAQNLAQAEKWDLGNATWVNGEILIRFVDHTPVTFDKYHKSGIQAIDNAFSDTEINEVEQLFPYQLKFTLKEPGFYTHNGIYIEYPKLDNIYRISFQDSLGNQMFDLIDAMESLDEYVLYAEPNFYCSATGVVNNNKPNDALYNQQWANEVIQADTVQTLMEADSTVSDTNQIIAIIDTGVDKDHDDLENKMWVNLSELNGSPNVDDDQNGFVDDIYGWDFINNDGNPMDDNGHGTHCAGSAAAETNNQTGIAGVSPGAQIMGIKVLQSSGYGNSADIAQGILYASNNGATVISMSLGGPQVSQVRKNALSVAYGTSFLVASAGNDQQCIGEPNIFYTCPVGGKKPRLNFPAVHPFVLGVESITSTNQMSGFTNYDQDGPYASEYPELYNYEVRGPGSNIISTIPSNSASSNRYGFKSGTSMATPAVAGGVSLLKSFDPTITNNAIFTQLIRSQDFCVKLYDALTTEFPPEFELISPMVYDTIGNGDGDGVVDAGETVYLGVRLKNIGGSGDTVFGRLYMDPLEDDWKYSLIDSTTNFGSVSEFAVIENNLINSTNYAFKVEASQNIQNNVGTVFNLDIFDSDSTLFQTIKFSIRAQNGVEFSSNYYPGKTVLYPSKSYIISGNTLFDSLIIKPGVLVEVEQGKTISAKYIHCVGTPDSLITITLANSNGYWNGLDVLNGWSISYENDSSYAYWKSNNPNYAFGASKLEYTVLNRIYKHLGQRPLFSGFYSVKNNWIQNGYYYQVNNITPVNSGLGLVLDTGVDSNYTSTTPNAQYSHVIKKVNQGIFYGLQPYHYSGNKFSDNMIRTLSYSSFNESELDRKISSISNRTEYVDTSNGTITHISFQDLTINNYEEREWGNNLFSNNHIPDNIYLAEEMGGETFVGNGSTNQNTRPKQLRSIRSTNLNIHPVNGLFVGGETQEYVKEILYDYFDNTAYSVLDYNNSHFSLENPSARAYVTDVLVNDSSINRWSANVINAGLPMFSLFDTLDFEVHFNTAMDTTSVPNVAFGTRYPYNTQQCEQLGWDSTGKIFYCRYVVVASTGSNGTNGFTIYNIAEKGGFSISAEYQRFGFRISTNGALSAGFVAVGDTGKIHLEWTVPSEVVDDYLGTNMYRIDSNNLSTPTYVYNQIQGDSAMTDTTVQAGKWYGYYYKVVRTSLTELNESDTVWARPWQGPPSVITRSVTNKTHNSATINGKVNPNYLDTEVRFNYGLTTNYSTNTPWQNIGNGDNFISKSLNLSGLTPGTVYHYRIEAKNIEGSAVGKDSTFRTKDFPSLSFSYDSTICENGVLVINNTSTVASGTLTYAWEVRNANGSLVHTSSSISPSFSMTQPGNYTIKLTGSGNDAVTTSIVKSLVVESTPTPSIGSSGPLTFCDGSTVTLSAPLGYSNYSWSNASYQSSIIVSTPGTYRLEVVSSAGCVGADSVIVNVNPIPTVSLTSSSGSFSYCNGENLELATDSNMIGYQWFKNGSSISGANNHTFTATSAGQYSVQATSPDGCVGLSPSASITTLTNPVASITASGSTTFCEGDSVVLQGPSNMTLYSWSTGSSASSIVQSNSGTITLTVVDSNGCSATSSTVQVVEHNVPSLQITSSASTDICPGQSAVLQASGGFTAYQWSNGANNQSIVVTTPGTYTVTGTTSTGCIATSSALPVNVLTPPIAAITNSGNNALCPGESVTLQATNGNYSYTWNTGDTNQSIQVNSAGSYYCVVKGPNGCQATSNYINVTQSQIVTPVVISSNTLEFCSNQTNTLTAPAGYSTYLWNTGATLPSISASSSGQYSVTVTNSDGCSATSAPLTITVLPSPVITVASSGSGTICAGGSETLNGPTGLSSYQWYLNGNIIQSATGNSITANTGGSYMLTATDTNGCSGQSTAVGLSVSSVIAPTVIASGSTSLCSGESVTLSVPMGYASYLWSDGSTTNSISATNSGTYSVVVTNAYGCNAGSNSISVNSYISPVATIYSNGDGLICSGESELLSATSTASSFQWYKNGSAISGADSSQLSVTSNGVYTLHVVDSNNCSSTSNAYSLSVSTIVKPTITPSASTTFCAGGSVQLSAPTGYNNYTWSTGASTSNLSVSSPGTYWLNVTNSDGCQLTSDSVQVNVNASPVVSIASSGDGVICPNETETLTAPSAFSSYQWFRNGNPIPGATSDTYMASTDGSYAISVTNSDGCSSTSNSIYIASVSSPTATISYTGSTTLCPGDSLTLIAPSSMKSYVWSTGETTQSIVVGASGNYSVAIEDINGCSSSSNAVGVSVSALNSPTIVPSGSTNICGPGNVTLTMPAGYTSYSWSTGANSSSIFVTQSGTYFATISNTDGCTAVSDTVIVDINPLPNPQIVLQGNNVLCVGDVAVLETQSYQSYLWSNGATTQSISVSNPGQYFVSVTDSNGCSASSGIEQISTSIITAPTISANGPLSFCSGSTVTLGVPLGYNFYSWSNGSTSAQLTVTQSGNHYVLVTNTDGCVASSDTVEVEVFAVPSTPSISYTANDTLLISSISDGNQWYFNGGILIGETNDTLRPLNLGNYSVKIIDTNGCEGQMSPYQFYNSVGIAEDLDRLIKLYPNPTKGLITIDLGLMEASSLRIIDAQGQMLMEQSDCVNECQLDLSKYISGIYRLLITTDAGVVIMPIVLTD